MHTGLLMGACYLVTGCSLAVGVLISFKSSPKPAGNVENNQDDLVTRPFLSRMFWSIYDTLHWIVISFLLPTAIVLLACYCWWVLCQIQSLIIAFILHARYSFRRYGLEECNKYLQPTSLFLLICKECGVYFHCKTCLISFYWWKALLLCICMHHFAFCFECVMLQRYICVCAFSLKLGGSIYNFGLPWNHPYIHISKQIWQAFFKKMPMSFQVLWKQLANILWRLFYYFINSNVLFVTDWHWKSSSLNSFLHLGTTIDY
jgi:hypothetical protein